MGLTNWIGGLFGDRSSQKEVSPMEIAVLSEIHSNLYYKQIAINIAINLIANALSKCEFATFEKKQRVKKSEYYRLNVEPNVNFSASRFWRKVVRQLVYEDDGVLIIQSDDGQLIIADSFDRKKYALYENIYSNVTIEDFTYQRTFEENEVIYLKMGGKVRRLIDGMYSDYGKIIGASIKNYNRNNAKKLAIKLDTMFDQQFDMYEDDDDEKSIGDKKLEDILTNRMKGFMSDKDAAVPLEDGIVIDDHSDKSKVDSRDIRAAIDDVFDIVSMAFQIPKGLLKGDIADVKELKKNFVTFCIEPIAIQLEDEINRKAYGQERYLKGDCVKVDTSRIENTDIKELATPAEIYMRIGVFSPNDILVKMLGLDPIEEEWANQHYVTKNYAPAEQILTEMAEYLKGGE